MDDDNDFPSGDDATASDDIASGEKASDLTNHDALLPRPMANPETVKKLLDLAIQLHTSGKNQQAIDAYKNVILANPNTAPAWINLGIINRNMGRYEPSVICLRRGLSINPKNANGWSSLGNALRALNRLEEAKRAQERGLHLSPEIGQIHYNYALVLHDLGILDVALKAFARAEALGYDKPELLWDRSLTYLTTGDFKRGFKEYEARWKLKNNPVPYAKLPEWNGDDISDKVLLVYAEQGQGDSLQFIRYLPLLKAIAKDVIFEAQPSLVNLFKNNPLYEGIKVYPRVENSPPPKADVKMALLSIPIRLSIEDDLFSAPMPYLFPPENGLRIRKPRGGAFRVGLAWAGKPTHKNDHNRSITLSMLSPILDMPGVEFVSFQLGDSQKQIAAEGLDAIITDLSSHLDDFSATASLLRDVDLLISVDTSIIHLAGAMGITTWAMIPFTPDWRWQTARQDTPWYPCTTLFRQTSPNDWTELFHRVREALKKKLQASRP